MDVRRFVALLVILVCSCVLLELARSALRARGPRSVAEAYAVPLLERLGRIAFVAIAAGAVAFVLSGCASMQTVREDHARGEGDARDYMAPEERAIEASRDVLRAEGAAVIEDDRAARCLWATFDGTFFATETHVGVCFRALDGGRERVIAISRRHQQTAAFTRLTEGGFHERLAKRLGGAQ